MPPTIDALLSDVRAVLRATLTATPRVTVTGTVTVNAAGMTGPAWASLGITPGDQITATGLSPTNLGDFRVTSATDALLTLDRPGGAWTKTPETAAATIRVPAPTRQFWQGIQGTPAAGWSYLKDRLVVQSTRRRNLQDSVVHLRAEGTWFLDISLPAGFGTAASDAWAGAVLRRYPAGGRLLAASGQVVRIRAAVPGPTQYLADWAMLPITLTWYADAQF
jgi:hypothetical protein